MPQFIRSDNPMCYDCPRCLRRRGQPCNEQYCEERVEHAKVGHDEDMERETRP